MALSASSSHHVAFKTVLNLSLTRTDIVMQHDMMSVSLKQPFVLDFSMQPFKTFDTVHVSGFQCLCHVI